MERSIDNFNVELTKVMKSESELNETVQEMEDNTEISTERIAAVKEQLRNIEMHKDGIIRRLEYLEDEIAKKEKLLD
jgi:septal ring factor EnvC (AmiA/AmiB activator)